MNRKPRGTKVPSDNMVEVRPTTKLLGQLGKSAKTISGVNNAFVPGAANDYVLGATHIALDTNQIADGVSNLADPAIQDVINAFSSAKGYTSSVTPTIVRGHLEQVIKAVESLIILKRSQDNKELTDALGNSLSGVFNALADGGRQYATIFGGIDPATVVEPGLTVTFYGTGSISNSVWANTYLSELSKFVIPQGVFDFLESFYSGVYKNHASMIDGYFVFWPSTIVGLTANTSPETGFANAVSSIDFNLSSYPDLRTIIGLLGIDASPCLNYDWTRDIKGQSLKVIDDPLIPTFFKNEFLAFSAFDEADVPQEAQDTVELPVVQSPLSYVEDTFEVGMDMIPYLGLFRYGTSFPALQLTTLMRKSGTFQRVASLPTARISFDGTVTALSAAGETAILQVTDAIRTGEVMLPKLDYAYLDYKCGNNNCTTFVVSTVSSVNYSGFNRMRLSETDHDLLNEMFLTELMFGPEYRSNLKRIADMVTANIKIG